jgi:hypothetical protein
MESPRICGMRNEFDLTIVLFTSIVLFHHSLYDIMAEVG